VPAGFAIEDAVDDDRVAIHEMGHCLVATALKIPLARVQLAPPRFDFVDAPERRLDHIRVLLAGGIAEEIVFGDVRGASGDGEQVRDLLTGDDDSVALSAGVRQLLILNLGTLRYLASRLQRYGSLTGTGA
jgi:ATP-dependent Zn protease